MPSDFPSFIESPFNTRVEYEEAKKLPEAERRLALHRAKKAPNTAPEAPALLALPAPEPAASGGGGIRTLDVLSGTPVVLDQYGPVVVNTDGTISRITNWDRMSEAEREVAKRRIAKRNVERMKAFAAAGELKEELVSALQTPDAPPPDSPPPDAPPPPPHAPKTPKTELAPMPDKCPVVAPDSVMDQKAHGTSETPVQQDLRWGCDRDTADKICNFNRHYAEHAGYFESRRRGFFAEFEAAKAAGTPMRYHDSNTGELLFTAPVGRTHDEFWAESMSHGWPSFRDPEVNWARVRCLANGECVSVDGTHLGHNLPKNGRNRYCINLVSVAGRPESGGQASG